MGQLSSSGEELGACIYSVIIMFDDLQLSTYCTQTGNNIYIYINYVIEHTCNIQICFSGSHSLLSHRGLVTADEMVHCTADSV